LVPFLTDALELVFVASDFIDAGWEPRRWNSEAHGWGHSFARPGANTTRRSSNLHAQSLIGQGSDAT